MKAPFTLPIHSSFCQESSAPYKAGPHTTPDGPLAPAIYISKTSDSNSSITSTSSHGLVLPPSSHTSLDSKEREKRREKKKKEKRLHSICILSFFYFCVGLHYVTLHYYITLHSSAQLNSLSPPQPTSIRLPSISSLSFPPSSPKCQKKTSMQEAEEIP